MIHLWPEVRVRILTHSGRRQQSERSQLDAYTQTIRWIMQHIPLRAVQMPDLIKFKVKKTRSSAVCLFLQCKTVSKRRRKTLLSVNGWFVSASYIHFHSNTHSKQLHQLFCMMTYSNTSLSSWRNAGGHFTRHILKTGVCVERVRLINLNSVLLYIYCWPWGCVGAGNYRSLSNIPHSCLLSHTSTEWLIAWPKWMSALRRNSQPHLGNHETSNR